MGGSVGGMPGTGGAGGVAPGPTTGGGMPLDFRRRETSKAILQVEWHHPVYAPDLEQVQTEGTSTGASFTALPREKAFYEIRDPEDPRPLLILRECDRCKGSDAALLSRKLDNERTVLMTNWFRCVKLPNDVLATEHPFRNLFAEDHPPHVFLCDPDGSNVTSFDGNQSQRVLWEAMEDVCARFYEKSPKKALKGLRRLLNQFDELDIRENDIRARLDDELVKNGPKSSKVKKLEQKLEALASERRALESRKDDLLDLSLRPSAKTSVGGSR